MKLQIEPGLGESELFYSWVIALFNIGALFGAVGSGLLIKYIPYWHLILLTLLTHTVGYILYAISNQGWVIMISKLLSGVYIGGEMTLALSYFAESSVEYENIMLKLGKDKKSGSIRRKLFAWHNVGVGVGYFIGPGMQQSHRKGFLYMSSRVIELPFLSMNAIHIVENKSAL